MMPPQQTIITPAIPIIQPVAVPIAAPIRVQPPAPQPTPQPMIRPEQIVDPRFQQRNIQTPQVFNLIIFILSLFILI